MKRRKMLAGMGALAAGGAAAMGTGAFSQATAQREFELTIEQDTQAPYLNFNPTSEYAEYDNNVFKLSFRDNSSGGEGVTSRANTWFENVFEIENLGTNGVYVWAPSFVKGQDPTTAAGAASVQFLVGQSAEGHKFDSSAGGSCTGDDIDVDHVDISWPSTIHPSDKPSNPVPQIGTGGNCTGQVLGSYKGVRYPGGYEWIPAGASRPIDVRFTVSNLRQPGDNLAEVFDSSFFITADTSAPDSTSDWRL